MTLTNKLIKWPQIVELYKPNFFESVLSGHIRLFENLNKKKRKKIK